jgi:chromate transporter
MIVDLFWRFALISLLAFGAGGTVLPLMERLAVRDMGWITPQEFAAALACGYLTPGPVLLTATFIGYRAAGLSGAVSATVGIFLLPWLLAAAAAQQLQRVLQHPWLAGFGRGAAPAVIGLFGVMALNLARQSCTHWAYALLAIGAFGLALWTKVHPVVLLLGGTVLVWVIGALTAPPMP